LDHALSLDEKQRAAWLDSFAADNPDLGDLVRKLLQEHSLLAEQRFLETAPEVPLNEGSLQGQKVGAYTLLSSIGQGGMGSVWLAERSDGRFERRVAVKFLHFSVAAQGGIERFKREGRILGQLTHPNIAELLDAGVTPSGEPYLVLEYVEGQPITEYCDRGALDVRTRIRLFIDVLSAVSHAHASLIVHRDLKPSNVLVSKHGQVKLLDFGIAKLLADDTAATPATLLTIEAGGGLTPQFAAPEQITGGPVTTATDVYALGVLLYLLLTGHHPAGDNQRSPADLVKAIVDTEPPRPSEITARHNTNLAASRGLAGAEKLSRELRGDLDNIVAKALKKNAAERYASVAALADDLQRYLKHEPVSARPDNFSYRSGRFIRRNRAAVGLSTIAIFAIIAGTTATLIQARTARRQRDAAIRERDRANRIAEFMTGMFKVSDPGERVGSAVTAREVLDKASKEISSGLSKDPEVQGQMMYVMGVAYLNLGLYSQAQSLLDGSVNLESGALGRDHPETLLAMQQLGWTLFREGRLADAERLQRQVYDARRRMLGPDNDKTLSITSDLANNLDAQGNHAEAEKLEREVFNRRTRTLGPEDAGTLSSMDTLAVILLDENRLAEADALESQALAIQRRLHGDENLNTIHYMMNEDAIQGLMGRDNEQSLRQLLELQKRILGPDQPETAVTLYNLASAVAKKGHSNEALSLLRQSIDHGLLPRDAEGIGEDPDLKVLHGESGFGALVAYAKKHAAGQRSQ
jgi:serine/threonine protein kinase